ncbi:hypothetical protein V6N13_044949 [Hibiscus sabdariffa]
MVELEQKQSMFVIPWFLISLRRLITPGSLRLACWMRSYGGVMALGTTRLKVAIGCYVLWDINVPAKLMGKLNLPVTSIQVVGPWKNWVASYFAVLSDRCKRILMVLYWSVWYSRNKMVHEGIKPVIEKSASFIVAFIHKQDNLSRVLTGLGASCESFWQAPSELVVKFNFDYAFRSGSITTGVVGRNNLGLIIASCSIQHENVADAFVAEALACRQVVWFARELGFSRVIIEGDSLTVIKKLNSNAVDRANKAAHALAYECRRFPGPCYWVEEAPVATTAECELDRSRLEQVSVP